MATEEKGSVSSTELLDRFFQIISDRAQKKTPENLLLEKTQVSPAETKGGDLQGEQDSVVQENPVDSNPVLQDQMSQLFKPQNQGTAQ